MRPQVIDPPSWTKLGLVYDAALHRSPWALHSALTPTPIIKRDGNLRVFAGFRDNSGVSRIGWVDLDRSDPARIVGIAERPALDIGRDGCFDDNGVILGDIVSVGGVFHLFYVGFQLVAKAKFLAFTGLAVSDDEGEHFERVSDSPVLDRGPGECMFAAVHTVRHEDGLWRFWFGGGDGFVQIGGRPMPSYGVGYVESDDDPCQIVGSRQRCLQPVAPEYRIGRPRVFRIGAEYRMICTAGTLTGSYLPVQAASVDGRIWTRDESPFALRRSASGWDSRHFAYATPLAVDDRVLMFYNGNDMGRDGFGIAVRALGADEPAPA